MNVFIVDQNQNQGPIYAANIHHTQRSNSLKVVIVNPSGDVSWPLGTGGSSGGDGAIVDGANAAIKATVRQYANSNPLTVVLVNISGDAYGIAPAGAGAGGDGAINDGANSSIKATVLNDYSALPGSADKPLVVTFGNFITREVGRVTVREITAPVGITGDVSTRPAAGQTWPVSVAGTVPVAEQGKTGVHVASGQIGVSGDVSITATNLNIRSLDPARDSARIHGGQIGITGDVLLRANVGVDIGNVGIKAGQEINVREQAKTGVHVDAGRVGVSGDVSTIPAAGQVWPVREGSPRATAISGDGGVMATVRNYANGKPIAVVKTNTSGDSYGDPTAPLLQTVAGLVSAAGSTSLVTAVTGKRIKVTGYSLQSANDVGRGYFASGASGSQLSLEWELGAREGVVRQIDGGRARGHLFATTRGQALSLEHNGQPLKYDVTYHVEDAD